MIHDLERGKEKNEKSSLSARVDVKIILFKEKKLKITRKRESKI